MNAKFSISAIFPHFHRKILYNIKKRHRANKHFQVCASGKLESSKTKHSLELSTSQFSGIQKIRFNKTSLYVLIIKCVNNLRALANIGMESKDWGKT